MSLRSHHNQRRSSDRTRSPGDLRNSKEHLDEIIASAMDAIISIDSDHRVILFNPAAEKMFGIPADEAVGSDINRFIPQRFRAAHTAHIAAFGQTGVTNRRMGHLGSISGVRADGQEFPIEASIAQVEVGGEKIFTVILRDTTERKRSEEALHKAKDELAHANAELERKVEERTARLQELVDELEHFSYSITHDMRAPLRAMVGLIALLEIDPGNTFSPQGKEFFQRIKKAATRMDALILDSLNYSKILRQELPLRPVNISELLSGIVQSYPNLQNSIADISIQPDIPLVLGNEAALTQCFSNLLGNAVKFVSDGVKPTVRVWAETFSRPTSDDSQPLAKAPVSSSGDSSPTVRIWVEDNGIGIPEDMHPRLFGMFVRLTTSHEGTGIGLAIVRKAVERMGGRVGLESQPNRGSRFWVELKKAETPSCQNWKRMEKTRYECDKNWAPVATKGTVPQRSVTRSSRPPLRA